MKKIILFVCAVAMAVSCSLTGGSYQKYQIVTTFDYQNMGVNYTEAFGPDSVYYDAVSKYGPYWQDLLFNHKIGDSNEFLGGFAVSYLAPSGMGEKKMDYVYNDFKVAGPALPNNKLNTYAVYYQNPEKDIYMPEHAIAFPYVKNGSCEPVGCYLTNTVEVADAIKENFQLGDRFTVTAIGYLDGKKTGEVEMVLADYSAKNDSIVSIWTPFELKALGEIEFIDFEVASTNPNVPAYFCIDNLVYNAELIY